MFNLQEFAKEVHQNAVEHGWWEGRRSAAEIRSLIHSEWSEALEEARAGRPMVWHRCDAAETKGIICEEDANCPCKKDGFESDCPVFNPKPEGIAVELIDGVIRILDYMEYMGDFDHECQPEDETTVDECMKNAREYCGHVLQKPIPDMDIGHVVDALHLFVASARKGREWAMTRAIGLVFAWLWHQGLNPETICMQKHRYNKTRPYKHGKKF